MLHLTIEKFGSLLETQAKLVDFIAILIIINVKHTLALHGQ